MKNKAILSIHFGTNDPQSAVETIEALDDLYRERYPRYQLYRAVTNEAVVDQMQKENYDVYPVREVLARMVLDGVTHVIAQPSYLSGGLEFEALKDMLFSHKADFIDARLGRPLLECHEDIVQVCRALIDEFPSLPEEEGVVLIGHGSRHPANTIYCALDYVLKDLGAERFFTGTFNAYPQIDTVIRQLKRAGISKVRIMPFMFSAGTVAMEGVCGADPTSMKSRLEAAGIAVQSHPHCLGELPAIRNLYAAHLQACMEK